jgi:hypothetical protein
MVRLCASTAANALILAVVLALPGSAFANRIPNVPLERKVALSDVVFIGRVTSETGNARGAPGETFATVEPMTILKGTPPKIVEVLVRGMIAEQNPSCCVQGRSYLFFLKRLSGAKYQSVNGPFGVYPMDANGPERP